MHTDEFGRVHPSTEKIMDEFILKKKLKSELVGYVGFLKEEIARYLELLNN